MPKKRRRRYVTDRQKESILLDAEKIGVPEASRKYGVSRPAIYQWRKSRNGESPSTSLIQRLSHLEKKVRQLSRLVGSHD